MKSTTKNRPANFQMYKVADINDLFSRKRIIPIYLICFLHTLHIRLPHPQTSAFCYCQLSSLNDFHIPHNIARSVSSSRGGCTRQRSSSVDQIPLHAHDDDALTESRHTDYIGAPYVAMAIESPQQCS